MYPGALLLHLMCIDVNMNVYTHFQLPGDNKGHTRNCSSGEGPIVQHSERAGNGDKEAQAGAIG